MSEPGRAPRDPEPDAGSPARAAAIVLFAGFCFATSGPLGRAARPISPLVVAGGRVAIAALVLFALDPGGVLRAVRGAARRDLVRVAGVGALLGAHFALFFMGLDRTSLTAAMALVSVEPLAIVVAAFLMHGLLPSPRERVGLGLATAGAAGVAFGSGAGEHHLSGDALVLGAAALFGVYVASARSLRDTFAPRVYAVLVYAAAAAVLAVVVVTALALGEPVLGHAAVPMHSILAVVAAALVPTVLGHTIVQAAARTASPALVALVCPLETVLGTALGVAFLRARPTAPELGGAALVLAGCFAALPRRRARDPEVA